VSPVVITGIGAVSAFGLGVDVFWTGLLSGGSALRPHGRWLAGRAPALEVRDWVTSAAGRRIDRASLLALAAARLALRDAGLPVTALEPARSGLALGSSLGNLSETPKFLDRVLAKGSGNPLVFPNLVMNAPLSYVSIELGITGPTTMVSEVEVSGEAAIAWGVQAVAEGMVDVCLAGGADELDDILFDVLGDAGGLSRAAPRPLDPLADGRALGEGAAVLVLEPAAAASRRAARAYAEIAPHPGFGVRAPVHGLPADPAPIAERLGELLAAADVVVAAASGLPALDRVEAAAIARAAAGRPIAVTAPRGAIGDFGAAGALGVAAAALVLHERTVPPTAGCRLPAREGLDVVTRAARPLAGRVAVVSALGRGGIYRPLRLQRPE
jgi:3-oxoacyl-[acyl-carrier-protein] synthase II